MNVKTWSVGLAVLFACAPAHAELALGGPPAFQNQVRGCLELYSGADQETRDIVSNVQKPAPAGKRHTLQQGPLTTTGLATATSPGDHRMGPNGPGAGSGSTITMNPLVPAVDFCSWLLHELKHASDFQDGSDKQTGRPRPKPGAGIPDAEIDAMRELNRFRKHRGLPQIDNYNGIPLPPDAIF